MEPKDTSRYDTRSLRLLGQGGESRVYELDDRRVLRVLKGDGDRTNSLHRLQELYDMAAPTVSFALPRLLEVGTWNGETYSTEERIPGRVMSEALPTLSQADRDRLLSNYLAAAEQLQSVGMPDRPYGELLSENPLTDDTWHGFLTKLIDRALAKDGETLRADTGFDDRSRARLLEGLAGIPEHPPKSLVHGDFYPSNVMVTDDLDVSGVLDFSPMTIVGDSRVDVAGSLMWLEVVAGAGPADTDTLRQLIVQRYGQQIKPMLDFYRIVYSLYFAGARDADPKLYRWCVKNLQRWQDQQRRGSQPSHSFISGTADRSHGTTPPSSTAASPSQTEGRHRPTSYL